MHSQQETLQILSRRNKVAAMVLRGESNQLAICKALGMDPSQRSTISRDIKAVKDEWKASAVRAFDEAVGVELAKLDEVEKEAWAAWERSKADRTSSRTNRRTAGERQTDEAEQKTEKRDGEARWLEVVLGCVERRCKLLGLNAPTKIAPTTPQGDQPVWFEVRLRADGSASPD
jgi:hypothetical protein